MTKILIADDDPDILDLLEYNLAKDGWDVHAASNGKQALSIAQDIDPDLIILDIMMPEYDGVEVCEKLRAKEQFKNTIIIFLTARTEDFTQIACYESGGDDYIVKPIKPKVLVSRLKAILRRQIGSQFKDENNLISFGDLNIDIEQHEVRKDGDTITLAKKEFDLLVLLVSKPGKLFTREEIFNKVWGIDNAIGDRTIDVHIRKLRSKLGICYIKTVKGVGYKLDPVDVCDC